MRLTSPRPARLATATAGILAAGLLLAACGSSDSAGSTAASSSPSAASTSKAAALVPDAIKKKGVINWQTDATYPPYGMYGTDGKTLEGVTADVGAALAPLLGVKVNVEGAPYDNFVPNLQSGRYDIGETSIGDTAERRKTMDFIDYVSSSIGYVTRSDSAFAYTDKLSFCGHSLATQRGSASTQVVEGLAADCKSAGKDQLTSKVFPDQNSALLAVQSGQVDMLVNGVDSLGYLAKTAKGSFTVGKTGLEAYNAGTALLKGSALQPAILEGLSELYASGELKKIFTKYGLELILTAPTANKGGTL